MDIRMQTGEVFDGKYEILEFLGAGGVGCVYKAKQVDTQRLVSITVLHPAAFLDDEFKARFLREGKALGQIDHKAIVKVFHLSISSDGLLYLVMEFIPGLSLRQYINDKGSLLPEQAIAYTQELAMALAYVHKLGFVHRDLKPENILVVESQTDIQLKIVDFGLAKIMGDTACQQKLTQTGMLIGTCAYMSPEQCRAEAIDCSSDIYSLAVCFYEFLSGHRPFDADTPVGIMYKHIHEQPAPLKVFADPLLNEEIGKILNKGMAKTPADRFASMEEFAAALADFADSLENRLAVSNLRKYGTALAGLLLLIIVLGGFSLFFRRIDQPGPASSRPGSAGEDDLTRLLRLSFKDQMRYLEKLKSSGRLNDAEQTSYFLIKNQKLQADKKAEMLFFHASCSSGWDRAADYAEIISADRNASSDKSKAIASQSLFNLQVDAFTAGLPMSGLRLLNKLEKLAAYLKSAGLSFPSLNPDLLPYVRLQRARILQSMGKLEEARKILAGEFASFSSSAMILADIAVQLKQVNELQKRLEADFSTPDELALAADYCLGAGLIDDAEKMLARAVQIVEESADPTLHVQEFSQLRKRGTHNYRITMLNISRVKILEEKGEQDKALALLLQASSADLSAVEKPKQEQLKSEMSLLLMLLGKKDLAWALHGEEKRISEIPNSLELQRLLHDLPEKSPASVKRAKELLACRQLPPNFRVEFAKRAEELERERAFQYCAAYYKIQRKNINNPLAELDCYLELSTCLRARSLSRAAVAVLSRADRVMQGKFNNEDDRKQAEAVLAECNLQRARVLNALGERKAALRIWTEFDNGQIADYRLYETALDFQNYNKARQILNSCRSTGELIMIVHICLRRGLLAQAELACRKARANLPEGAVEQESELIVSEIFLLLEQGKLKEAAEKLSRLSSQKFDSLTPAARVKHLDYLILLSALAERPDIARAFYKQLLECKTEVSG